MMKEEPSENIMGLLSVSLDLVTIVPNFDDRGLWFSWYVDEGSPSDVKDPQSLLQVSPWNSDMVDCANGCVGDMKPLAKVQLSDAAITKLLRKNIYLKAYMGSTGSEATDECMGQVRVDLTDAFVKGKMNATVVFKNESDTSSEETQEADQLQILFLGIQFIMDEDLKQYCAGARLLTLGEPTIEKMSSAWEVLANAGATVIACIGDEELLSTQVHVEKPNAPANDEEIETTEENGTETKENIEEPEIRIRPVETKTAPIFVSKSKCEEYTQHGCPVTFSIVANDDTEKRFASGSIPFHVFAQEQDKTMTKMQMADMELAEPLKQEENTKATKDESKEESTAEPEEEKEVHIEGKLAEEYPMMGEMFVSLQPALRAAPSKPKPALRRPRDLIAAREWKEKPRLEGECLLEQQIKSIINWNADEFRTVLEEMDQNGIDRTEFLPRFLFGLNQSGTYNVIRERLRFAIASFIQSPDWRANGNTDAVLCSVYSKVLSIINKALNERIVEANENPEENSLEDLAKSFDYVTEQLQYLQSIAQDAIIVGLYDKAGTSYQERIRLVEKYRYETGDKSMDVLQYWYDAASFSMGRGVDGFKTAEQDLHNSLAIDDSHVPSLFLYGALLKEGGADQSDAEVFLWAAAQSDNISESEFILAANGVLSLFDTRDCDTPIDMQALITKFFGETVNESLAKCIVWSRTCEICLKYNLFSLAQLLMQNIEQGLQKVRRLEDATRLKIQSVAQVLNGWINIQEELLDEAMKHFSTALKLNPECTLANVLAAMVAEKTDQPAKTFLEAAYDGFQNASETSPYWMPIRFADHEHYVTQRLGELYLRSKQYNLATRVFRSACERSASPASWLGVGIAAYHETRFQDALDAFAAANRFDPESPAIWGYLCLACEMLYHESGRADYGTLAMQSFEKMQKGEVRDFSLLSYLGRAFHLTGRLQEALDMFEAALGVSQQASDVIHVKLEMAEIFLLLKQFENAVAMAQELPKLVQESPSHKKETHMFLEKLAKTLQTARNQ